MQYILSESLNLQFDTEGGVSLTEKLINHAKSNPIFYSFGLGKTFQIWSPTIFEKFKIEARKKLLKIEEV